MYNRTLHFGDISNLRFLIVGGAGFIGSNIATYLLKHKAGKVRVLDDLSTGFYKNIEPLLLYENFEFIEGDIRDYDTCLNACKDIDLITHQAAIGSVPRSVKNPMTTNDVNVSGFVNMLFAAKESGIKRLIYASSSSVYGDELTLPKLEHKTGKPLSPYAVSKKANELYADVFAELYGIQVLGLRYFNIFGPNQDPRGAYAAVIPLFIDGIMHSKPVYIDGDGGQTRDFTYIENAVQANIKALTKPGIKSKHEVFNIAVGENFSVNDLYREVQQALNSSHKPVYRESRPGDIRNSLADISKAKEILDYKPDVDFKTGIMHTIQYFKNLEA
jgi:UDP-N-acetylglucosamine/UDP-N-acetyl-alpha-D-glucosaminouronate 4-epimerase